MNHQIRKGIMIIVQFFTLSIYLTVLLQGANTVINYRNLVEVSLAAKEMEIRLRT